MPAPSPGSPNCGTLSGDRRAATVCESGEVKFVRPGDMTWSLGDEKFLMAVFTNSPLLPKSLLNNQDGQDIAEYAVMLAVILVIVVGTIRLVGSNANNVFSSVASSVQ